ncbi:porin [Yoonia litorea]|uniref:Porin n=1 Tax=Yoonia litorea TaxID=1123755 RepID=A0A1I6MWU2_9RHOB|nr:porin [Yoonia litorea]SFS20172.1 porin [Yoonia litorea]
MKSILLTTTAIVAFAGAAAADGHAGISFSGSATLGYNTSDEGPAGDNDGFYGDMELDVSMVAALDNGITVTATADVDDLDVEDAGYNGVTLEIASEMASLTFGDTNSSADTHWSGVDGDSVGDFRGTTEHLDNFDAVLRGEATFGGVTGSVSYGVNTQSGDDSLNALQVAAVADVAGFTVIGAYEEAIDETVEDFAEQFGVSVSGAVAGFDVTAAYLSQDFDDTTSLGVSVSAPFGPVTVGGYYSMNESDNAARALDQYGLDVSYVDGPISVSAEIDMVEDADDAGWSVDANYDTGLGAIIHAGVNNSVLDDELDYYVAGTYDLGGGATLLVSYAIDEDGSEGDEIGEDELQNGTTVEVSFSF